MMRQILMVLWLFLTCIVQAQPQFSQPHGLYSEQMTVAVMASDSGYTVHYTLDGSEPTPTSPVYQQPFVIDKTTILRAIEVKGDVLSSVTTASYIYPQSVLNQTKTPEGYPQKWGPFCQISGTAPAYYEMYHGFDNYEQTIPYMLQGLTDLPILSLVTDRNHLFLREKDEERGGIYIYTGTPVGDPVGRGWERPVSIELMGGPQGHDLTYDCGISIHGGHGRLPEKNPKHSFRLKFKQQYAGKKTLHYAIFSREPLATDSTTKYDQLVLRCHFGNSWQHWDHPHRLMGQYTRDLWARQTQKRMGWTAVEGLYVNLFINGLYWGLYNIAERIDDQFCKDHEGGTKSSYDVIKVEENEGNTIDVSEGTLDAWNEMVSVAATSASDKGYLRLQGLNAAGERDETLEPLLCIDNFIDYMLINQYAGNNDWDVHNWYAFRQRGAESKGFKFLCWDSEQIFEGIKDNRFDLNRKGFPTGIFLTLMQHPDFMHRYMDRAYEHLSEGGMLSERQVIGVWDSLYYTIQNALYLEASRWGNYRREIHPWQKRGVLFGVDTYYMSERSRLLTQYFPTRTAWMMSELINRHWMSKTEAPTFLLNGQPATATDTLSLLNDQLTLSGPSYMVCTTDGKRPVTWVGNANGAPTPTSFTYDQKNLLSHLTHEDEGTWVTFRAVGKSSAEWSPAVSHRFYIAPTTSAIIDCRYQPSAVSVQFVYDLQGRRVATSIHDSSLPSGIYIVNGKKVMKK